MKQTISELDKDNRFSANTDLSSALMRAIDMLKEEHEENRYVLFLIRTFTKQANLDNKLQQTQRRVDFNQFSFNHKLLQIRRRIYFNQYSYEF